MQNIDCYISLHGNNYLDGFTLYLNTAGFQLNRFSAFDYFCNGFFASVHDLHRGTV